MSIGYRWAWDALRDYEPADEPPEEEQPEDWKGNSVACRSAVPPTWCSSAFLHWAAEGGKDDP